MQKSKYDNLVLIGFGTIYKKLLKYLIAAGEKWEFRLSVIEHEFYPVSRIESVCMEAGVEYARTEDKSEVLSFLLGFDSQTLIISAGNKFLFPKKLVEKENITIINFHNALLPSYPGRNAPSWAIYNDEKYVGATWHLVTDKGDVGAILWQKACELPPNAKAYEAARMVMELAYQGFEEISERLFSGSIEAVPQNIDGTERCIYYARDIPGNGMVKITDPPAYIDRVLRAADYGFHPVFPKIKLITENGEVCVIKRYIRALYQEGLLNEPLKRYYLRLDKGHVLRLDVDISEKSDISYNFNCPDIDAYNRLRVCVGWEPVNNYLFRQAMENSIVVTANARETVIGLARMITDGGMMSFIVDVMVQPEYQNYGIGTDLVKILLDMQKEQLFDRETGYVSVLAAKGKTGFYKAAGFAERPNVMLGPGMTAKIAADKINKYER